MRGEGGVRGHRILSHRCVAFSSMLPCSEGSGHGPGTTGVNYREPRTRSPGLRLHNDADDDCSQAEGSHNGTNSTNGHYIRYTWEFNLSPKSEHSVFPKNLSEDNENKSEPQTSAFPLVRSPKPSQSFPLAPVNSPFDHCLILTL